MPCGYSGIPEFGLLARAKDLIFHLESAIQTGAIPPKGKIEELQHFLFPTLPRSYDEKRLSFDEYIVVEQVVKENHNFGLLDEEAFLRIFDEGASQRERREIMRGLADFLRAIEDRRPSKFAGEAGA